MNKDTANKMSLKVINFLSQFGGMPAIKKVDERILKAERKLNNRLLKLQAGVESEFVKALRERGYLPSNHREQRRFVSYIFDTPFEEMKTVIADEAVNGFMLGRQMTFENMISQGFEIDFIGISEFVERKIKERSYIFSDSTFERIQGNFIKTLSDGYEEGYGIDEIARDLKHDFKNLRDHELTRIARTEIQSTQSEGAHQTMLDYGANYKQWISVGDDRVRGNNPNDEYDHVSLHGQVVEINEPFSNGLMHPGDRNGDIGDWINCRCVEVPYIPRKDEHILTTPYYP